MFIEVKWRELAGKIANRKFRRKDFIIEVCAIEVNKRNQNVSPTVLFNWVAIIFSTIISHLWCFHVRYIVLSPIRGDILVEEIKNNTLSPIRGDIMVIDIDFRQSFKK